MEEQRTPFEAIDDLSRSWWVFYRFFNRRSNCKIYKNIIISDELKEEGLHLEESLYNFMQKIKSYIDQNPTTSEEDKEND